MSLPPEQEPPTRAPEESPAERIATRLPLFLLALLLGLFVLGGLALWVSGPLPPALDVEILRALRNPNAPLQTVGPLWLGSMVRDVTSLGSTFVVMGLPFVVAGGLWLQRERALALYLLALVFGAQVLVNGLKLVVERARPTVVPQLTEVLTHSFPSAHATLAACLYPTLAALLARRAPSRALALYCMGVALLLVFLVGMSRLILGVHYPSDVLGGWVLGGVWAGVAWHLFLPGRGKPAA